MKKVAIDLTWVRHGKVGGTESSIFNLLHGLMEISVCSTKPLKKSRTALDTRGERLRCFEFDEMAGI